MHHSTEKENQLESRSFPQQPILSTLQSSQDGYSAPGTATGSHSPFEYDEEGSYSENLHELGPRTVARKGKKSSGISFKEAKALRNARKGSNDSEEAESRSCDLNALITFLPSETIARIFAYLDPISLSRCASVCQLFSAVVRDDATWREAFAVAFDVEKREAKATTPVLRRVDRSSWKVEYVKRAELLRRWCKARSPTVISDPRISTIHAIALSLPHHFMISASQTYGVASRCDPFTGKVAKGFVDAAGQLNGAGFGPIAADPSLDITTVSIDADASRIVWGFHNGGIGMTILQKQGTNPRGTIKAVRFSPRGFHVGPVLHFALPFGTGRGGAHSLERSPERLRQKRAALGETADTFVSAGMDGTVRLWSPNRQLPLWSSVAQRIDTAASSGERTSRPNPVVCIDYDAGSGTIVASTMEGEVVMWTGIDVNGLLALHPALQEGTTTVETNSASEQAEGSRRQILTRIRRIDLPSPTILGKDGSKSPSHLILDLDFSASSCSVDDGLPLSSSPFDKARVLILCMGASAFQRIDVKFSRSGNVVIQSAKFVNPSKSEITSIRPDFDLGTVRSAHSRPPTTPSSPALSPHADRSRNASPLVLGPSADWASSPEAALFAERKYVCAGTDDGRILFWDWDDELREDESMVEACLSLAGHHTSITALDLTEHVIVAGCSDGTIKAYCPLTGQLVRTFNDRTATRHPARMLAAGELTQEEASRFVVRQIVAGPETLVASIGPQVLAWRAEKIKGKSGRRTNARSAALKSNVGKLWDPKHQSQREMEHDVVQTRAELEAEHQNRVAKYEQYRYAIGPPEIGGLSEHEAFEYAMMLSKDEEEARRRAGAAAGTKAFNDRRGITNTAKGKGREFEEDYDWELEDALEQIAMAESSADTSRDISGKPSEKGMGAEEEEDDISEVSPSPSPVPSPHLGGVSSPSRAWDILNNAGPAARSVRNEDRWRPNSKVRMVNVPRSARLSSSTSSSSPAAFSRRPSSSHPPPEMSSPNDWPSFSPSPNAGSLSRSPAWSLGPSAAPSRQSSFRGIDPVRSPPASGSQSALGSASLATSLSIPARVPQGAWATGSPLLKPSNGSSPSYTSLSTSRPSALSSSRPQGPAFTSPASGPVEAQAQGEMDDDLKLAIELSLAEERSRASK